MAAFFFLLGGGGGGPWLKLIKSYTNLSVSESAVILHFGVFVFG